MVSPRWPAGSLLLNACSSTTPSAYCGHGSSGARLRPVPSALGTQVPGLGGGLWLPYESTWRTEGVHGGGEGMSGLSSSASCYSQLPTLAGGSGADQRCVQGPHIFRLVVPSPAQPSLVPVDSSTSWQHPLPEAKAGLSCSRLCPDWPDPPGQEQVQTLGVHRPNRWSSVSALVLSRTFSPLGRCPRSTAVWGLRSAFQTFSVSVLDFSTRTFRRSAQVWRGQPGLL